MSALHWQTFPDNHSYPKKQDWETHNLNPKMWISSQWPISQLRQPSSPHSSRIWLKKWVQTQCQFIHTQHQKSQSRSMLFHGYGCKKTPTQLNTAYTFFPQLYLKYMLIPRRPVQECPPLAFGKSMQFSWGTEGWKAKVREDEYSSH